MHRATLLETDKRSESAMMLSVSRCFGDHQLKVSLGLCSKYLHAGTRLELTLLLPCFRSPSPS